MVKVTPHDNLVPCVRDSYVLDFPHHDLIHDPLRARHLIRGASQFFHLRRDAVIYSGYLSDFGLRNADCGEVPVDVFTIHLWHEGVRVRSLILSDLGYGGVLHCETVGGRFEEVVGWDLIGALSLGTGREAWAQSVKREGMVW